MIFHETSPHNFLVTIQPLPTRLLLSWLNEAEWSMNFLWNYCIIVSSYIHVCISFLFLLDSKIHYAWNSLCLCFDFYNQNWRIVISRKSNLSFFSLTYFVKHAWFWTRCLNCLIKSNLHIILIIKNTFTLYWYGIQFSNFISSQQYDIQASNVVFYCF